MTAEHDETEPSPAEIEDALEAFQGGSPEAFDLLLAGGKGDASDLCTVIHEMSGTHHSPEPATVEVDDYTVLREIGSGGMAVVYEARQERAGRTVALKVIRRWESSAVRQDRLFRRELNTLARLKHQHIATLYDAGQTKDGHYFVAMELVPGVTLDEFVHGEHPGVDPKAESGRRTLRLFCDICRAMNYAHQRGVIHCDLKPSNIIVDADGSPKILDFGLARLIDPELSGLVSMSMGNKIMGTLSYMSPEQARGRVEELDIRCDVYSLGVVLYELICARPPYRVNGLALPEALRAICEDEPRRPGAIHRTLKGDLDAICLKALEKDPARRYQSAGALADDVERFLEAQPVLARNPSAVYQVSRLISRHKIPAMLSAVVLLLIVSSAVVFAVLAARLARERDRAAKVGEYLGKMTASFDPHALGAEVAMLDILDKAAAGIDGELHDQPDIRATLHHKLGRCYLNMRDFEAAEREFRAALTLWETYSGKRHPQYASTLHQLGLVAGEQNRKEERDKYLNEAYVLRCEILGEDHPDIAESLHAKATRAMGIGDFQEAEALNRRALKIHRGALGDHPRVAVSLHELAYLLVSSGRYDEAEPLLDEALALRRRLLGRDHFDVAITLTDLGEIYLRRADFAAAEQAHREQVRILRRMFRRGSKRLAWAMSDLANIRALRGGLEEAETLHREAVEMEERVLGKELAALCDNNYGGFLRDQGRFLEAESYARRVFEHWYTNAKVPGPGGAYACQNLGLILLELGQHEEAEQLLREAAETWRALFEEDHPKLAMALTGLGRLMHRRGLLNDAERQFADAVAVRRNNLGADDPLTAASRIDLSLVRYELGHTDAVADCRGAVESLRARFGDQHPLVNWAICRLGKLMKAASDLEQAEALFRECIRIERGLPREKHPVLADALAELGEILLARGDAKAAEEALREALAIRRERYARTDSRTARAASLLGRCLLAREENGEAKALLLEAIEMIGKTPVVSREQTRRTLEGLVQVHDALGLADEAAIWRTRLDEAPSSLDH